MVWIDDRVLVTQTGPNHQQIERLLSMMRQKGNKFGPGAQGEGMQMYQAAVQVEQSDPALALARYKDVQRLLTPDALPADLSARIARVEERLKRDRAAAGH